MTGSDPFVEWQERRRLVELPSDFADQVMLAVESRRRSDRTPKPTRVSVKSILALAAGVLLIVLLHAGSVGLGLFAVIGVAQ